MVAATRRINRSHGVPERRRALVFYILLLVIPLTQIAIFYFGVNFQSFFMAFQKLTDGRFVFDIGPNWRSFMNDIHRSGFWKMVGNSFLVYLFGSLSGTILATVFSYYIYKKRTLSNLFKFLLFLPSILPAILLVVMFEKFAGEAVPAFTELWFGKKILSVFDMSNAGSTRFIVVTIYSIWISFGSQVLVYTGAMDQIPVEVIEAGKIDGTNAFTEFIHIILPSILSTVGTFLVAGIASLFTNQNNMLSFFGMMGSLETERTIGFYLYLLIYSDSSMGGYTYASFLGLLCTLIVVPLSLGLRKGIERVVG